MNMSSRSRQSTSDLVSKSVANTGDLSLESAFKLKLGDCVLSVLQVDATSKREAGTETELAKGRK